MNGYEKTFNLYKRFKDKPYVGRYDVDAGFWAPEFGVVRPEGWIYTEKIDGMNIRIILKNIAGPEEPASLGMQIRGRTDRAQLPRDLVDNIGAMIDARAEAILKTLPLEIPSADFVTLYGEGYGPGIQKNGGQYRKDKGFMLFDIAIGHTNDEETRQHYVPYSEMIDIAKGLDLPTVPRVFDGLGLRAVTKAVREGFTGTGGRQAEGIVGHAPGLFYFQDGGLRRLKFKLKTKDFPKSMRTMST